MYCNVEATKVRNSKTLFRVHFAPKDALLHSSVNAPICTLFSVSAPFAPLTRHPPFAPAMTSLQVGNVSKDAIFSIQTTCVRSSHLSSAWKATDHIKYILRLKV